MTDQSLDPVALAFAVAVDTAGDIDAVGPYVTKQDIGNGVTDFRFEAHNVGYEGWQWSVTLYHDTEADRWTVDESSLVPTDQALLPPQWIPWKDRLLPSDLSVTDSIGTPAQDERLVAGTDDNTVEKVEETVAEDGSSTSQEDVEEAIEEFDLSRRRVLSELGRTQTAQRWYDGPHGPKSLSTRIAEDHHCSTCGFLIPLQGDLGTMFGVCANRWSPDDGKVVALDHGCGEHSDIEPPEPSSLWMQTKPAYDDVHIDVVEQSVREENAGMELLEQLDENTIQEEAQQEEVLEHANIVLPADTGKSETILTVEEPIGEGASDACDENGENDE